MLLAQLTDTHVIDPDIENDLLVDNNERLRQAVRRLNVESVRPEVVLATGDLTDNGSPREMELLAELLAPLEMPLLPLPGNHDRRDTFRSVFDMPWATDDSHLSWTTDVGDLHIIGLDTTIPGSHDGLFDRERQEWLSGALAAAAGRRIVIAMHHPPFASGIQWMDRSGLEGMDTFAEIVGGAVGIERVLCGHLHRPLTAAVGGIATTVGPSTIQHVELDLQPDAAVQVIRDPVGYQLHNYADGVWVSHIRYIDTGEDPIVPVWSDEMEG